jgi:hypothetical protein
MTSLRAVGLALVVGGIAAGSIVDDVPAAELWQEEGYTVLAADFHVHSLFGDGGAPPWELWREARRRGLDVIAVTNHNQRLGARIAAAAANRPGRPIVLVGEEVTAPTFHMVAAGISDTIDWRLPARDAIRAIHAQGGIAIAAHPDVHSWRAADEEALRLLDGAEVAHPSTIYPAAGVQLLRFYRTAAALNPSLAPIGSSDFHYGGTLGLCRTFVFARDVSQSGVLEAVREARTVARDAYGRLTGEPSRVEAVQRMLAARPAETHAAQFARVIAWLTLAGLFVLLLFR